MGRQSRSARTLWHLAQQGHRCILCRGRRLGKRLATGSEAGDDQEWLGVCAAVSSAGERWKEEQGDQ